VIESSDVQIQVPVLADEIVAETVVRLLAGEHEPEGLVDLAGRGEYVVGPQRDSAIAGVPREVEALLDEPRADAEPTGVGGDQQDAQLCDVGIIACHAEDAPGASTVDFGDPRRFASRVAIRGVVGDDAGHQSIEVGVPPELPVVGLAVGHDDPTEVTRSVGSPYRHPCQLVLLRHDLISRNTSIALLKRLFQ